MTSAYLILFHFLANYKWHKTFLESSLSVCPAAMDPQPPLDCTEMHQIWRQTPFTTFPNFHPYPPPLFTQAQLQSAAFHTGILPWPDKEIVYHR